MQWTNAISSDGYLVIGLLIVAVALFITEWIRPDLVALLTAVSLTLSEVLTVPEALAGFSSEAVIAIASLLVIGKGLVRSGVVRWIATHLKRFTGESTRRLVLVTTAAPGLLSGFINIVAAVSVFIPAVLRLAKSSRLPPQRLLMPMAYCGLLGANLSLIGASHNLVVDNLIQDAGLSGLGFFEFTPVGTILLLIAILYSLILGGILLPRGETERPVDEEEKKADGLAEVYDLHDRLWQLWVKPGTPLVGKPLAELSLDQEFGLTALSIMHGETQHPVEKYSISLQGDEILLVAGRRERVDALVHRYDGLVLLGPPTEKELFPPSEAELIEVAVPARSQAIGKTVRELSLRQHTGLNAIALWRDGRPIRTDVSDFELQAGDALLLFGARNWVRGFDPTPDFLWLRPPGEEEAPLELRRLGRPAALIFLTIIAIAAMGWVSIAVATLLGAGAMVSLGILRPEQAYRAIDWRTVVLIAGMLPMGTALNQTGVADLLAQGVVQTLGSWGPVAVLVGITLITMLFTQPLHNAAVAVIMVPVALSCANMMNVNPRGFAVAVLIGASAKFLLPVGHPATLLVKDPGKYRTVDHLRFGIGLIVLTAVVIALMVPLLWPLTKTT